MMIEERAHAADEALQEARKHELEMHDAYLEAQRQSAAAELLAAATSYIAAAQAGDDEALRREHSLLDKAAKLVAKLL